MENSLNIRIAKPEDAKAITTVMRNGFDEKHLAVLIYGCAGIDIYIKYLINMPEGTSDTAYVVAEVDRKIVGCVEFRSVGNSLVLNYISVASSYRSSGLGSKLLKEALRITSAADADRMLLDVFEYNHMACGWYDRLGFDAECRNCWWVIDVPVVKGCIPGVVSGYPQSEACQKAYGFSRFRVHTATGTYTVGRIGDRWFRVRSGEALMDKVLHVTLREMDDTRRYLAILEEGALAADLASCAEVYTRSTRMSIDMKKLLEVLG
jgi:ribosomal protein S18 acetylase RimI-like enzyme